MSYLTEVDADNPTAYWRLGEPSGTTAQEENNLYDGTYVATPTLGATGAILSDPTNTAVTFTPAQAEAVSIADNAALRPGSASYSVEFWIKRNGNPSAVEYVICKPGGGAANSWDVDLVTTGTVRVRHSGVHVLGSTSTVTDNQWHHVVFVINSGAASYVYIDGAQDATATVAAYTLTSSVGLVLGARYTGTYNLGLNGSLDEVALYIGTALSSARVAAHFNAAAEADTPGAFPLDEDFTAANATHLGDIAGWLKHQDAIYTEGRALVQANRLYNSVPSPAVYYNLAAPPSADYSVTADVYVATMLGNTGVGPVGRVDATDDTYYELNYLPESTRWRLARVVDGVLTEIGSYTQTLTAGQTYAAKLEMIGPVLRVYIAGTERINVTDPTPITAAGQAGLSFKGGGTATTTTGLHIAGLQTAAAAAPSPTTTFVAAGTAASAGSGTITPGLPGGVAANDLLVALVYSSASTVGFGFPTGWTVAFNGVGDGGRLALAWRAYQTGVAAPGINLTGTGAGIAQVAAFRGIDLANPLDFSGSQSATSTSSANIGPITGMTPGSAKSTVLVVGGRADDWTSVATLSGDSLTWAEIGEPDDATNALGLVWNYAIQAAAPTAVTAKTFTVTGGSGAWRGRMLGLRAGAATATGTAVAKVRIDGAWVTKPVKVRSGGTWTTKPTKVLGAYVPPPPPPPPDPDPPPDPPPDPQPTGMQMIMWHTDRVFTDYAASLQPEPPNVATRAELTTLRSYGVDGFAASVQRLGSLGQPQAQFENRINALMDLADATPEFRWYIVVYLTNGTYFCPIAPWFDDTTWNIALDQFRILGEAVGQSRIVGIGFDGEDYKSGATRPPIGWVWSADPSSATEAQVRAKARARAVQIGEALVDGANGPVDVGQYYLYLHGDWRERVQREVNGFVDLYEPWVSPQWIDGLSSVSGITYRHWESVYYKPGTQVAGTTKTDQHRYDRDNFNSYSFASRSNVHLEPMIWVTEGPNSRAARANGQSTASIWDRQYSDGEIRNQLQHARAWTEGGMFILYEQLGISPAADVYARMAADFRSASA